VQTRSLIRWLFRAPAILYSIGAGRLLGHRFLLLTHRGRKTGRSYRCVLEVLAWRPDASEAIVISGFGRGSNWYQNVVAGGAQEVAIGRDRFMPQVRVLETEEGARVLADYERRHRIAAPVIRRLLAKLIGLPYDRSNEARLDVVRRLPLVGFCAAEPAAVAERLRDLGA
jgi:deazaflavin-dependent oxidoreductase (nitroreductase family)